MSQSRRVLGTFVLVVASLLVTAVPASATSATGRNFTLPAVTKTTYSISGTVRANVTSAAVAGVQVSAQGTTSFGPFTTGSATTSAGGAYTITHLLPGSYNLRFDPPRATNLQHGYRNSTAPTYFSVSTAVAVKITTASRTGINIRLPAGFKISGKVTRSNGTTAIPNVSASASGSHGSDSTSTDSSGNYTLMGLSPGSYQVSFGHDAALTSQSGCWYTGAASRFSASCASHTAVVISSANKNGISPKIPNALKITGFIKTRASAPIVGAVVRAGGATEQSADTDATCKYTIAGLNPGSYKIEVDGPYSSNVPDGFYSATGPYYWNKMIASAASVAASAAVTTLATIKPPTGFFITGTIANVAAAPLASVLVEAVGGAGTAGQFLEAFTDSSGQYSLGPVPPGNSYKVTAISIYSSDPSLRTGWYRNNPPNNFTDAKSAALTITVNSNKTGINMRLPKGASISGIVHLTGGSACSTCFIFALSATGSLVTYASVSGSGAYLLQGLAAGSYYVEAFVSGTILDATHVRLITGGYYKSGAAPNFSPTQSGATAIAVSP